MAQFSQIRQIHILWSGPYGYLEVRGMKEPTDHGLYQIYGQHPVYGTTLVYIGRTVDSFGSRFGGTGYRWMKDVWADNATSCSIYTGRIHSVKQITPSKSEREKMIHRAEKLLIGVHQPAWNAQDVDGIDPEESKDVENYHVFNWGQYASLLPEASGARHAWHIFNQLGDQPLSKAPSNA